MTDAEIRERSTLTLLRFIARQEDEIEGLRKTLASTAQPKQVSRTGAQTALAGTSDFDWIENPQVGR